MKRRFLLLSLLYAFTINGAELMDRIKTMPKTELHLHLGGAFPLDYLMTIATEDQAKALSKEVERIAQGVPYGEVFEIFSIVSNIMNTEERIEKGTEALCRALDEDGVVYAEIRTGLKNFGNGYEGYLLSVLKGIESYKSDKLHVRLLLSLQRTSSMAQAKETIDLALKYRDRGIVGIDISGNAMVGQIEGIAPEILRAKDAGLFISLHLGEFPDEQGQKGLIDLLQPHRISHGVHLDPDVLEWLLENKIPIEVCLTSSQLVQMMKNNEVHPGIEYHRQGHPIVIGTDDPLIFSTTLSKECALLHDCHGFSIEQIENIAKLGIEYSFLSEEEKDFFRSINF